MNIRMPVLSNIPALRSLWKEAFGDDETFLDCFFSTAFSEKRCRCVFLENKIVAMLYWFDCIYKDKPVAYLYAIATAPSHQGQGLCHLLMTEVHVALKNLGYSGALLVPASKGLFDFYQNTGYQTSSYIDEFSCSSSDKEASLRQVSMAEYAALRRRYLPIDGVLQEDANLDFLAEQATFYAGDDFLLTAHIEEEHLFAIELLGNTCVAPDILQALHCVHGTFRTPGSSIPFAMYYDLSDGTLKPPSYFGLAFD